MRPARRQEIQNPKFMEKNDEVELADESKDKPLGRLARMAMLRRKLATAVSKKFVEAVPRSPAPKAIADRQKAVVRDQVVPAPAIKLRLNPDITNLLPDMRQPLHMDGVYVRYSKGHYMSYGDDTTQYWSSHPIEGLETLAYVLDDRPILFEVKKGGKVNITSQVKSLFEASNIKVQLLRSVTATVPSAGEYSLEAYPGRQNYRSVLKW